MDNILNEAYSDLLRRFNKVQLVPNSKNTIEEGNAIFKEGVDLLKMINNFSKKLETMLSDCQDFVKDAVVDLNQKTRDEDFVFHTTGGMLSYNTRSLVINEDIEVMKYSLKNVKKLPEKTSKNESDTPNKENKSSKDINKDVNKEMKEIKENTMERILIKEMSVYYNAPTVTNITDIPPMFHYYKGDQKHQAGLYCCLVENVFIRVPYPEVIDSTKNYSKFRSIRCKYKTKAECDSKRAYMAEKYPDVRQCNFAHVGEKLVKIGYPSRCIIPNFGNPETFHTDYKTISRDILKTIMLYGVSDLVSAALTIDNMKWNSSCTILDNIN